MTELGTVRDTELPRLGEWTGAAGLRRVQEERLPGALSQAARVPATLARLAGADR